MYFTSINDCLKKKDQWSRGRPTTKGHRDIWGEMELFCSLSVVAVTQVPTLVKAHRIDTKKGVCHCM